MDRENSFFKQESLSKQYRLMNWKNRRVLAQFFQFVFVFSLDCGLGSKPLGEIKRREEGPCLARACVSCMNTHIAHVHAEVQLGDEEMSAEREKKEKMLTLIDWEMFVV